MKCHDTRISPISQLNFFRPACSQEQIHKLLGVGPPFAGNPYQKPIPLCSEVIYDLVFQLWEALTFADYVPRSLWLRMYLGFLNEEEVYAVLLPNLFQPNVS